MVNWLRKKEDKPLKEFAPAANLTIDQRGIYAEQALHNPVIMEAFQDIDARLMKEWRNTLDDLNDQREIVYHRIKALEYIKQALTGYANAALLEREMKKQEEEQSEWMQQKQS